MVAVMRMNRTKPAVVKNYNVAYVDPVDGHRGENCDVATLKEAEALKERMSHTWGACCWDIVISKL